MPYSALGSPHTALGKLGISVNDINDSTLAWLVNSQSNNKSLKSLKFCYGDSWTVLSSVTATLCNAASVMDTVNRNHTLSILAMVVLSYLKKLSLCRRLTQSALRFSRLTFRKDILSNHSLMWRTGHWHKTWLVFYLMRLLRLARWLWHELLWFYQGCAINVWELPSSILEVWALPWHRFVW